MSFHKVELNNFRNFRKAEINLEDGVNVFYGDNAQGKTNFLESLYLLSRGKSFRTLDINHCLYESEDLNQHISVIKSDFLDVNSVNNKFKLEIEQNKKTVWLNQKRTLSTKISTLCPVVLFSPESLIAIKNGPSERRDLIDDFIESLPEFTKSVSQYRKVLKARNKILNDVKKEIRKLSDVIKTLDAINDLFLKQSLDLIELRLFFLKKFEPYIIESIKFLFGEQNEFRFRYVASKLELNEFNAQKISEKFRFNLERLLDAETSSGYSLLGPHKDEVEFLLNGKDSRYYCSQGQQRGLIIAFKIAEVLFRLRVRNERPVLLLDDVMSELDEGKRIKLVDFLKSINSQIVITTTDRSNNVEKSMGPHTQFKIDKGTILNLDI
jgi:DNA replication and repair protein RecF